MNASQQNTIYQQILSPQELYCCDEFANFVRLAILPPPPNAHLIDVKPHAHFGSKQARAAAREKAQASTALDFIQQKFSTQFFTALLSIVITQVLNS
ncbi:hypothetical protein EB796_005309 [Bugula neritina]|uniref:Uncharacterized protein n=1 Tax=Bugula neritina TaxID=10212 RepID=A0A7J7KDM5_BUGNE|nr:hypothetical protein EB796_005309 [Bugula neritina]